MKRKHPLAECEDCPLAKNPCAPTTGPKDARYAFVSRSPGYYEGRTGKPFSGPSGQVLEHLLKQNGQERENVLLSNVVLCTHEGNTVPPEAIKACSERLHSEIKHASTVIAGGSEALAAVLGRRGIDSSRAYVHFRDPESGREVGDTKAQKVVVTNNPALVLRDDSTFPNLVKDFRLAFHPRPAPVLPEVKEIDRETDARRLLKQNGTVRVRAADIETRTIVSTNDTLVSFNLSENGRSAGVITEPVIGRVDVLGKLRGFLEDRSNQFIWHNGKFDCKVLRKHYGIQARVDEDTMLLSFLLDERPGYHSLEYLLMDELGWPYYSSKEIEDFKTGKTTEVPDRFYRYAGFDAAGTYQLFERLYAKAKEEGVLRVYSEILVPIVDKVLIPAEMVGVRFDIERAANIYEVEVRPKLREQTSNLRTLIQNDIFNPNSSVQVQKLYLDNWGVQCKAMSRPDKKRSIDKVMREQVLEGNFTIEGERRKLQRPPQEEIDKQRKLILEFTREYHDYKALHKQASTYLLGIIVRAEADPDGRVYTEFNPIGAESGRLSSKAPNLQNITRPKAGLPNIRSLFLPSEGRVIVSGDLSQAELRTIAILSQDPNLLPIYRSTDRSIHREMATSFYGSNYSKEEYTKSKNINFGIAYLQGAFSFSQMYHMPQREAQDFIDMWFQKFPRVKDWQSETWEEAKRQGFLVSAFGRRRRFHLITDENRDHLMKEAVNFRPQSTANDITLCGAIELAERMDWSRASIIILVHDSIVSDVDEDYVEEYSALKKECMESQAKKQLGWDIPFPSDISIGPNWGEMEEVELGIAA